MLRVCEKLGIPVALDKLEGPATTITFLGITINIALQQLRFPPDKLQEMTLLIKSWLGKHKTTKRDLLSLIGKLSFAAKVVPSGRHFLRRLIELSITVSKLHHHIHLNVEAREDIIWWNRFLPSWNGHPPPKTTPRHSTNSGTIRDGPEYEPPAGDYPGVYISSVIPKTIVAPLVSNLHTFSHIDINLALRAALASCISFLVSEYVPTSCSGSIDRVSYLHHMNGHRSPASTNQGIEHSMPAAHLKPKHQPITNEMLGQMLSELDRDHKPSHDRFMLKAAIILGFFGLFRVSEFIVPNRVDLTLTSSLPQRTSCVRQHGSCD
ncbi:hypothetical protein EMCRGX_G005026 [Ephydatia muelleri]